MKRLEKFLTTLSGLLWSWGSNPPPEAAWTANDLLDWIQEEYHVEIRNRINEDPMEIAASHEAVVEELKQLFPQIPPIPVEPPVHL